MAKGKTTKPATKPKKVELTRLPWKFNNRQTLLWMLGIIVLVSVVVFWRFLSGHDLFLFEDTGSDSITLFYPNIVHHARYFQEVGFPGWSFFVGLGESTYPGGLLNPWDWIYFPMGPKSIAVAIGYVQWIKLIACGFVFGLFLKKMEMENPVIVIGGLIYAFGGYLVVGSGWYIHTTHIFWMTVSFLAFEMLLRENKWWLMPFPFLFLAGTRAYFLVLFLGVYIAVRVIDYYGWDVKKLLKVYGRVFFCGIIALMLASPFIGERFAKLYNSPRVSGNVSKVESLSATPVFELGDEKHNGTAILRWFSNDILGADAKYVGFRNYLEGPLFYMGLLTLLLFPQFFWMASRRQRWVYGLLLGLWLWMILFPWFRYAFYAFAGSYYKGALSLFIPFSLALVSLLALNKMVKGQKINLILLSLTLIGLLIALWYPYGFAQTGIRRDIQGMASGFLIIEAILLASIHSQGFRKWALGALIGVVALEAGVISHYSYRDRLPVPAADLQKPVRHFDDTRLALDYIRQQPNESFYRIEKTYGSVKSGFNDAQVQGFFSSKTYQSHNNKYYIRFLEEMGIIPKGNQASSRWLVGFTQRPTLHPFASVKYVLSNEAEKDKVNLSIYELETKTGSVEVYKTKYFIPFGIPLSQYFLESEFLRLENNEKIEALYYGVVIPDEKASQLQGVLHADLSSISFGSGMAQTWNQLNANAMKMTSFSHSHIQGEISMAQTGVVVFSMPFDDGWHIYVDGVEKDLLRIDLGFTGVKVEAGAHRIELRYVPLFSKSGWIVFGMGAALFLFLLLRKVKLFPIASTA